MTNATLHDAGDELAKYADSFAKPSGIYMDGNSLGLMCQAAENSLYVAVEAWRNLGIRGWTEGAEPWFGMDKKVSRLLAPLLGCEPDDVTVSNTTTGNLHQLLATFVDPQLPEFVIDGSHFPSDRYAVESFIARLGKRSEDILTIVEPRPDKLLDEDRIIEAMSKGRRHGQTLRFAVLPSVVYTTGQLLDINRITRAGREMDFRVAWDCSHSAGVVPHHFRDENIELAFGCGYKYLNGGPGAAAWLYVHPLLRDKPPGLAGWFGSDPMRQFEMSAEFHPAADARRFQIGTPQIFSLAPLLGSLRVINDAGIDRIRAKSLAQTRFLMDYAQERLARFGVGIVTPRDDVNRGGHVTFSHPDAAKLSRALRLSGVVPDFRPPDMLRFAPAPLYISFAECKEAIDSLENILSRNAQHELTDLDELVT